MNDLLLPITQLKALLSSRKASPVEVTDALLKRIEATNPSLNAYLRVNTEAARRQAEASDLSLPLGGIPIAVKDLINEKGEGCTCGSKILQGYKAPYDATVIARLKQAGAILVGRTNMDEFAMGSSNENSSFGPARNPWDLQRTPGGSSGGSAAAVSARSAIAALGTDTGGSIRQPASLCGCVGLKPTYGRVSRYGLVAFASSLDQIGPITQTVEDAALIMSVIAGHDPKENTSSTHPVEDYVAGLRKPIRGIKVGIPKEHRAPGMDPQVQQAVEKAVQWYEKQGAQIVDIALPHTEYAISAYYIIAPAEASANLARFDGVRYGYRASGSADLMDMYMRTRTEGFGPEVKRRIILGTYVLSSGYYDAYYNRAQKVRQLVRRDFVEAFKKCDIIATPTSPTAAFRLGEKTQDPLQMYLADIFTVAINLGGVCGISIPCGFTESGLPIGLQLVGSHFAEETILRAAYHYEQVHTWHQQKPSL